MSAKNLKMQYFLQTYHLEDQKYVKETLSCRKPRPMSIVLKLKLIAYFDDRDPPSSLDNKNVHVLIGVHFVIIMFKYFELLFRITLYWLHAQIADTVHHI